MNKVYILKYRVGDEQWNTEKAFNTVEDANKWIEIAMLNPKCGLTENDWKIDELVIIHE